MGVENKAVRLGQMLLGFLTIFPFRQDTKEAQLYAAQAHLKLGEVSVESGNTFSVLLSNTLFPRPVPEPSNSLKSSSVDHKLWAVSFEWTVGVWGSLWFLEQ